MKEKVKFVSRDDFTRFAYALVDVCQSTKDGSVTRYLSFSSYRRIVKELVLPVGDSPRACCDTSVTIYKEDGSYYGVV